ncbi:cyclic nucleotide-gated cation channel beta-3 isoform X3 [Zootermopsis nevadensis]|uniref:cyclic nucleotide-gated cation channel beta-3 isoform X3 n=1 Tax=Zootermopsis nevadensis TaxID=136037 RepID=UPI000B8E7F8C|nr:cyclic nucleotide-gated cation channel beta-3 isoform X3 [Zootermopsis nevadensis]
MDRIRLIKKRMVYPERLELDSLIKSNTQSPASSWCNESQLSDLQEPGQPLHSTDIPGLQSRKMTVSGVPMLLSVRSLDDLEQGNADRQSTISTNIYRSSSDENSSILHADGQLFIHQRIRHLVRAFTERAQRIRRRIELPPTPSTISSDPEDGNDLRPPPLFRRLQLTNCESADSSTCAPVASCRTFWGHIKSIHCNHALDPQRYGYISWLFIVMLCYMYNCWVIPLRNTFPYQTTENTPIWLALDYSADAIYFLDVAFIKPRLKYLEEGFWVADLSLTRRNYIQKWQFKMDVLSLLPLDLLYLIFGTEYLMLRIPRLLKVQTFWEFFDRLDNMVSSPYVVRMARTLTYMLYLIHLNACAYYAFSSWKGLGTNSWVFNGKGSPYIRCFYFATKTATSIGKNPKPETEEESLFMTCSWLMGVFVFAILIGQMRDIVVTATRSQTEYKKLVDEALEYMRCLNLPHHLQERVKLWFTFTWEQQHTLDESSIMDTLPHKMKTDIAINVHIQTLSKVQLFHDCDEALLRELVLKLRPVIFLPGDFICRKGEVGKEMYIVKTGQVQVMGGEKESEVLATLTEGSVFGEISLLAIAGCNRRTATVRSRGFSNLFVLSKTDLNEAIAYYPDAQEILKKKAKQLIKQNADKKMAEVIIGNRVEAPETPRLVHTVMQVVPANSPTVHLLKYGSRRTRKVNNTWINGAQPVTENQITDHVGVPSTLTPLIMDICSSEASQQCNHTSHDSDQIQVKIMNSKPRIVYNEDNTFQCLVTVHREMSQ